jgi:hypothetical protein
MIRAALTIGLLLIALPAQAETMILASHYKATGKNPDGSKYTGTVDVNIISDTTFSIVWHISGSVYKGFGMRMNDSLAATYTLDGEPGLVIYKAAGDGSFGGLWAVRGQDGSGSEVLTPVK